MLTFNRLEMTKQSIDGYLKDESKVNKKLYIIDQGSNDGTRQYLQGLAVTHPEAIQVKLLPENVGIARGSCLGYLMALGSDDYDLLIKIDNDIRFVTPEIFDKVVDFYKADLAIETISSPMNVDIDPAYMPSQLENVHNIKGFMTTTHVGGLFMVLTRKVVTAYLADSILRGEPVSMDIHRCAWFRSQGYQVGYIIALEVGHIGEGKSTPNDLYKF